MGKGDGREREVALPSGGGIDLCLPRAVGCSERIPKQGGDVHLPVSTSLRLSCLQNTSYIHAYMHMRRVRQEGPSNINQGLFLKRNNIQLKYNRGGMLTYDIERSPRYIK